MQKLQLELLFHIIGIGSASGLIYKDNGIFLISDNSNQLCHYSIDTQKLEKTVLFENAVPENIPKNTKRDFEAIAGYGDDYYIFGSGATENRNLMVHYNSKTKAVQSIDLTYLYALMQSFGTIKSEDFNIEGVIFTGKDWYFFQRGNAGTGKNGIFTVRGKNLENDFTILYNPYKLPKIKGVQSSFTDAVLVDSRLFFLATAENTASAYDDGEILGSYIGSINTETMKIESKQKISDKHKFEGITLYRNTGKEFEFLLCEDNDTTNLKSDIYNLKITL